MRLIVLFINFMTRTYRPNLRMTKFVAYQLYLMYLHNTWLRSLEAIIILQEEGKFW